MTHSELCEATAKRFVANGWLALWEYQSWISGEFPDVLVYGRDTTLFEIKMSRSDFLADAKKEARRKWSPKGFLRDARDWETRKDVLLWINQNPELYFIQTPHLGAERYFVCEPGVINPEDLPQGWGLYWYKSGRFFKKAKSARFRANVREERDIAVHALRKYASEGSANMIVNEYLPRAGGK